MVRSRFSLSWALLAVGAGCVAFGQQAAPVATSVANEVIVKFKTGADRTAIAAVTSALSLSKYRPIGGIGAYLLHSSSVATTALVSTLKARSDVVYAEPNYVLKNADYTQEPYWALQWGLQNYTGISAPLAWSVAGTGSRSIVVGVVDTAGMYWQHPDLTPNIWTVPAQFTVPIGWGTQNQYNLTCVQDSHGLYYATDGTLVCDDTMDTYWLTYGTQSVEHATEVAGVIGGSGNNNQGTLGVDWSTSLMRLPYGGGVAGMVDAVEFAVQAKAIYGINVRVLNCSCGVPGSGFFSYSLLEEINRAGSYDMLLVAAAGNGIKDSNGNTVPQNLDGGSSFYPASYDTSNMIAVAATTIGPFLNQFPPYLASFSNYGPNTVHLAAPGQMIYTTEPLQDYGLYDGTSLAAPFVSGVAALALSKQYLDVDALKATLLDSVDVPGTMTGSILTSGYIDASKAVATHATSNAFFIHLDYLDLLGRTADYAGLQSWLSSGASQSQMAMSFLTGSEFQQNGWFITSAYISTLGWSPDFAGWLYYQALIRYDVVTQEQLVDALAGNITNSQFVNEVYQNTLGCTSQCQNEPNYNTWINNLNNGTTKAAMIMDSQFQSAIQNQVWAATMYLGFLRRAGASSEVAYWTNQLNAGVSRTAVATAFITCAEYTARYY